VPGSARTTGFQSTRRQGRLAEEMRREFLPRRNPCGPVMVLTREQPRLRKSPRAPERQVPRPLSPSVPPLSPGPTPRGGRVKHPGHWAGQQEAALRQLPTRLRAALPVQEWGPPRRAEERQPRQERLRHYRPRRRREWPRRRLFLKEQCFPQRVRLPRPDQWCFQGCQLTAAGVLVMRPAQRDWSRQEVPWFLQRKRHQPVEPSATRWRR
jgi:hypothetical protein